MSEMNNGSMLNRDIDIQATDYKDIFVNYADDDVLFIERLEMIPAVTTAKVNANIFCFCDSGNISFEIGEDRYEVKAGEAFICPSGVTAKVIQVSDEVKYSVLCLTDRIIRTLLNANVDLWHHAMYVQGVRVVSPPKDKHMNRHVKMGWHFTELLHDVMDIKENPFRKEMLYLLLQMGLLGYCAQHKMPQTKDEVSESSSSSAQSKILFTRFMDILNNERVKHQPVYYYAEKLCISSKYLSHICKEYSGQAATDFIQNAVMGDILHYLRNTSLSVKEISVRMGFKNISFFGKYVKSHLGMSPNTYRKKM